MSKISKSVLISNYQRKNLNLRKIKVTSFINSRRMSRMYELNSTITPIKTDSRKEAPELVFQIQASLSPVQNETIEIILNNCTEFILKNTQKNILFFAKAGGVEMLLILVTLPASKNLSPKLINSLLLLCILASKASPEIKRKLSKPLLPFLLKLLSLDQDDIQIEKAFCLINLLVEEIEVMFDKNNSVLDGVLRYVENFRTEKKEVSYNTIDYSAEIIENIFKNFSLTQYYISKGTYDKFFDFSIKIFKENPSKTLVDIMIKRAVLICQEYGLTELFMNSFVKETKCLEFISVICREPSWSSDVIKMLNSISWSEHKDEVFKFDSILEFLVREEAEESDIIIMSLSLTFNTDNKQKLIDIGLINILFNHLIHKTNVHTTILSYMALSSLVLYFCNENVDTTEFQYFFMERGIQQIIKDDSERVDENEFVKKYAEYLCLIIFPEREQLNESTDISSGSKLSDSQ